MTTLHASGEGDPPPTRTRRWLLVLLYVVAAVAIARAVWLVPAQVSELHEVGYFEAQNRLSAHGDARLSGRVLEAWVGVPVPGVELEFVRVIAGEIDDDPNEAWLHSRAIRVRSDEDGRFDTNVAPGMYQVSVDSEHFHAAPNARIVVGRNAQIPSEEIVVVHSLCDLEVRVVDDAGHPLTGAEVFIRGGDPGRAFYSRRPPGMTTTDEMGEVLWRSWCGPATVRYVAIEGRQPAFVERSVQLRPDMEVVTITLGEIDEAPAEPTDPSSVHDPNADNPSNLRLPARPRAPDAARHGFWGAVHAEVVDPRGAPVDAIVRFELADQTDRCDRHDWRYMDPVGFTRDGGRVLVEHLEPGRFRVIVHTSDQPIRTLQTFTHPEVGDTDLGRLVLQPVGAAAAHGRVLGPDGPVGGAEVYVVATEDLGRLFYTVALIAWTPRTVTAADGTFRLEALPEGEVVLVAYHADVGASVPTTVAARGELTVDLHLDSGTTDRRTGAAGGCMTTLDPQGVFVSEVSSPSRAMDAGLLPGDRLMFVEDIPVRWMRSNRLYALLSGEERGVPRTVSVMRPGEEEPRVLDWGGDGFER
jgi:hypothetical protein